MWLSLMVACFATISFNHWYTYGQKTTDPIVDTGYAKYIGNRTYPNTVAYLGVPYAEPPLGQRRFRAPLPLNIERITLETRGAVVNTTSYPASCIQGIILGAGDNGSEDCLKVNIYTPAEAKKGSDLPVLVYIHGGGYVFGNPASWPFAHWVHQSPNVVIVSVYYRLSSFGFLATPEFKDSNLADLNAGFLDQKEALRWVKRHIVSFGGDPNKVTINGESAGGSSVELHLIADRNENLFAGAIAQSVYRTPLPTPEQQKVVPLFQFYAQAAGCGSGSISCQMECLRSAPVGVLARAQDLGGSLASFNNSLYNKFLPGLDGKIFTEYPTQSITSGKFASVPLIVGATTNETLAGGITIQDALIPFCPSLTTEDANELEKAYPETDFASSALRVQTVTGDVTLRCARTIMATSFSHVTAWTYRYNQSDPTSSDPSVAHAAENWMMFLGTNSGVGINGTTTFTPLTRIETLFSQELIAYWLSFVRSGNPNTYKLARSPVWPSYSADRRSRIVLQQALTESSNVSGSFVEVEGKAEAFRCRVIASQAEDQQN